jgi:hypothetical protein
VLFFNGEWGSSASRNVQVIQQDMINNHIVPMPGNWALSRNGDYSSSADLTTFGKSVVEGADYGLLALAKPATMF